MNGEEALARLRRTLDDLDHTTGVAGFFGASSTERLPTEVAITENMRRFKRIARAVAAT